ncbi:hypothetical protein BGZ63DRAFT_453969 [Mariannaea sp. PMI_226]|nr:hypothetical protein BGZ63DRAFT_453969 [Mariannaea sp. PMI_226]
MGPIRRATPVNQNETLPSNPAMKASRLRIPRLGAFTAVVSLVFCPALDSSGLQTSAECRCGAVPRKVEIHQPSSSVVRSSYAS